MSITTRPQHHRWRLWLLMTLCALAALATTGFGLRSYWSFQLMRSAYAVGAPGVSNLRAWMTLRYVATTYRAPEPALIARLGLAPDTDVNTTLKTIAGRENVPPLEYVQRVQRVVAELVPVSSVGREKQGTSWLSAFGDQFLAALLLYGYPVLGLALFLGALGVPLPAGLIAAVAGSLAAQGKLDWFWASAVAIMASVVGDGVGYGLGRMASAKFLTRWGYWVGYTPPRYLKVTGLFERHGVSTLLLSRTLVSHLSSVVSLLAGAIRYRLATFLAYAIIGRMLWTAAYVGLGYVVGGDLETATRFLQNLAGVLISFALLVGFGLAVIRSRPVSSPV